MDWTPDYKQLACSILTLVEKMLRLRSTPLSMTKTPDMRNIKNEKIRIIAIRIFCFQRSTQVADKAGILDRVREAPNYPKKLCDQMA